MGAPLTYSSPAGAGWEEVALDAFDRLTHCAQWKPLVAKVTSCDQSELGRWPSVRLYDTQHGQVSLHHPPPPPPPPGSPEPPALVSVQDLDIGAELVRLGYAVPVPCAQEGEEGAAGDTPVPPVSCYPRTAHVSLLRQSCFGVPRDSSDLQPPTLIPTDGASGTV